MRHHISAIAVLFFLFSLSVPVFSQTQPRVGILPFSGGSGRDGERLSAFLTADDAVRENFNVVRPTVEANELMADLNFLSIDYTDSDILVRLGEILNVDFIISGHILQVVDQSYVITIITNVKNFEQLGGDWREFTDADDYRSKVPEISQKIISFSERETGGLPKLAIAPFYVLDPEVDLHDAQLMYQLFALEIINTGRYAAFPRISLMHDTLDELEYLLPGVTAEEEAQAMGKAAGTEYVLTVEFGFIRSQSRLNARIYSTREGIFRGEVRDYGSISEGVKLLPEFVLSLNDRMDMPDTRLAGRRNSFSGDSKNFWSAGVSAGIFLHNDHLFTIASVYGTASPFPYQYFEAGMDFSADVDTDLLNYHLYPFIHYGFYYPVLDFMGFSLAAGGSYHYAEEVELQDAFSFDFSFSFIFLDFINLNYTLRTDFGLFSNVYDHKISLGLIRRF